MTNFPVHTLDTAPEAARPSMEALQSAFGFLPNIAAVMATSPVLIGGLVGLFGQVHGGSFSETEIQTLLLTDAVANRAEWAVAFHSHLALQQGIDADDVSAIRGGLAPKDTRLAALSDLARAMIERRGHLDEAQKQAFLRAGFTPEHLLEVVAVVAASTITNYTASIAEPPLEPAFAAQAWRAQRPEQPEGVEVDPAPASAVACGSEIAYNIVTEPADFPHAFDTALNWGELDQLTGLYEDDAVLRVSSGEIRSGGQAVREAMGGLIAARATIANSLRHIFRSGDVALIIVDYVLRLSPPDGDPIEVTGAAANVIRRDEAKGWRLVVANPQGTA